MRINHSTLVVLVCLLTCGDLFCQQSTARGGSDSATQVASASTAAAQATVPRLIRINGILRDLSGKPIAGTADVTFSLYSEEAGGAAL